MSPADVTFDLLSARVPLALLVDLAIGAPPSDELYALEQPVARPTSQSLAS